MGIDIAWSATRIAEFAPDAASVAAGRRLVPELFRTGSNGTMLWGQCAGSASAPYMITVDVDGPAFACSCPSRKRPCKHVLGLLIAWSEDAVPERDSIPDGFARPTSAAKSTPLTPNPATAARRAERVTAGLEDLDTWLLDQVRTGLAQVDRSPAGFDTMAARMVDAQAPGIASTLRRIPYAILAHDDWPARVLTEYAQLHLLVTAHRRLDALPPGLQESVRAHVGYPTKADAVLARPAVRDEWMVLGTRTTEEEQLYSRRVWLRGRSTHRWAMLLDFAYGTTTFDEVPDVGTMLDADVHHYPGAAELRAKLGARHRRPQPFTTLATGTIAGVLDEFAAALAADPWTRIQPAVLGNVIPTVDRGSWRLVDSNGVALALAADPPPWQLLGISGGFPITVTGVWDGNVFAPVSAIDSGVVIPL